MAGRNYTTLAQRVVAKWVEDIETGCWNWAACKFRLGYGAIKAGGKIRSAHRVSYELHIGEIVTGMGVLHSCDNRSCVNPAHLFLGTHTSNMQDMHLKGRWAGPRGSNHHLAKLSEQDIPVIRNLLDKGLLPSAIARKYGVTGAAISRIATGQNWGWLI